MMPDWPMEMIKAPKQLQSEALNPPVCMPREFQLEYNRMLTTITARPIMTASRTIMGTPSDGPPPITGITPGGGAPAGTRFRS